jgi:tetratricopeptide (TPR) repeat protein
MRSFVAWRLSNGRGWAPSRWWLAATVLVVLAAAALGSALAWRGRQPERRFARALAAVEAGHWDALPREIGALEASPGFEPHAHFLRGLLRLEAGKYYAALEEFGHAVDHPDLRVRSLTLSGKALYQVRELGPAIRLLSQAVQIEPDAIEAHRWLALAYYYLGMTHQTTAHLHRVAELAPDDPRPYRFLGMIEKDLEQYPAAVDYYQEALRRKDQHLLDRQQALLELAECQIKVQQDEAALDTLSEVAPSVERWVLEAECHRRANQNDQAERRV